MNEDWLKHLTFKNALKALVLLLLYCVVVLFIIEVVIAMIQSN